MLRQTLPILCASALLMVLAGCGGDDPAATTGTTTAPEPPPPPPPPEPEPIRLHLTAGDSFTFKQTTTQEQVIAGTPQGDINITMKVISAITYSVDAVAETGDASVKITFGRVHGTMNNSMMGMGEMEFDSEKPSDNPMVGMVAGPFTALAGSTLQATVTAKGEMSNFKGTDEIAQKLLDANPMAAMQGADLTSIRTQLEDQTAGQMAMFPDDVAKVGMTWNVSKVQAAGRMELTLSTDYELVSDDDDQYVIESVTKGSQAEGAEAQMTLEDFTANGSTVVEQGNGVPTLIENDASIALSMQGPMGAMSVKQKITNRLERVDPDADGGDHDDGGDLDDDGAEHEDGDDDGK